MVGIDLRKVPSGTAQWDLFRWMREQFELTGRPIKKSEIRQRFQNVSGGRLNELLDRLESNKLIHRVKRVKIVDEFIPDPPEAWEIEERARRESLSSRVAAGIFEAVNAALKSLPPEIIQFIDDWRPADYPKPPLPNWLFKNITPAENSLGSEW